MPFSQTTLRIGFVLVEMFPLYGAVLAAECLRLANKYADRKIFDWVFLSEDGGVIPASNGMSIATTEASKAETLDYVFVIAGYDQDRRPLKRVKALLRRLSRYGGVVGAVDSGAFLLADAGVLAGHAPAVHFESLSSLEYRFPDLEVSKTPVSISPRVMTCAGGALSIRLMLLIVRQQFGEVLAQKIEGDLHLSELSPLPTEGSPRSTRRTRLHLEEIVDLMQRTIDEPTRLGDLAAHSGYSVRELSRAFNDRFGESPMKYYQRLRLDRARQLLYQGTAPVSDVAMSCGFSSLSAFSRAFKSEFGQAPTKLMATFRREGFAKIMPAHQVPNASVSVKRPQGGR